jgi:hypothetical protein
VVRPIKPGGGNPKSGIYNKINISPHESRSPKKPSSRRSKYGNIDISQQQYEPVRELTPQEKEYMQEVKDEFELDEWIDDRFIVSCTGERVAATVIPNKALDTASDSATLIFIVPCLAALSSHALMAAITLS